MPKSSLHVGILVAILREGVGGGGKSPLLDHSLGVTKVMWDPGRRSGPPPADPDHVAGVGNMIRGPLAAGCMVGEDRSLGESDQIGGVTEMIGGRLTKGCAP
jgi:hypothetical protein